MRRATGATIVACLLLAGCPKEPPPELAAPMPECLRFDGGRAIGRVSAPSIDEASGLVSSRVIPGLWWTHNDSGDVARLFALESNGSLIGTVELPDVRAVDWEDLAVGPGPGGSWLTVGDIGDNARARSDLWIHRLPEPVRAAASGPDVVAVRVLESWTVRYEDAPHDAETLLVDPRTGETFLVTKEESPAGIYRVDFPPPGEESGGEATARRVGEVDLGIATAGDVSPDGRWIVIRSYREARIWARRPGEDLPTALAGRPCPAPLREEAQGESIAFDSEGSSYATLGERVAQPLWSFRRVDPGTGGGPAAAPGSDPAAP